MEFKPVYYRRYVGDIFVLFCIFVLFLILLYYFCIRSRDNLNKFRDYLNQYHLNMKFSFEEEKMESCLFYIYKCLKKDTSLSLLSIVNLLLVVPTRILIAFYMLHKFSMIYTLSFNLFELE